MATTTEITTLREAIGKGQGALDRDHPETVNKALLDVLNAARAVLGLKATAVQNMTVTLPEGSGVDALVENEHDPQERFVRVIELAGLEAYT